MEYSILDFSRFCSGTTRQALLLFGELVERGETIPYKIRNKEFSIEVAATSAFTLKLVFVNVLIEDGRHPLQIQMDDVRFEKEPGICRLRFHNRLTKNEAPLKESSFLFDRLSSDIRLWNYHFYTLKIDGDTDKLPWRLLVHPMEALVYKQELLGTGSLNEEERRILPAICFVQVIFSVFLDEGTKVAYGRSNLYFDQEKLQAAVFTDEQAKAGVVLMEQIGWLEAKQKFIHRGEDATEFFRCFIYAMTQKEGKALFTWLVQILESAAAQYPGIRQTFSDYDRNRRIISSVIQKVMDESGYSGFYPDYRKEMKAAFLEISQVYERKYTYLNEKRKLMLVSFVESISEGVLTVTALFGTILGRNKTELYDTSMTAWDGCFTDGGRRRFRTGSSLRLPCDLTEEEVAARAQSFIIDILEETKK